MVICFFLPSESLLAKKKKSDVQTQKKKMQVTDRKNERKKKYTDVKRETKEQPTRRINEDDL